MTNEIIEWLKNLFYSIKWAIQRASRGYDDRAIENYQKWFLDTSISILDNMYKSNKLSQNSEITSSQYAVIITKLKDCFEKANDEQKLSEGLDILKKHF